MSRLTEQPDPIREAINPDCRDGKHHACRGDAWSMSADKPTPCVCSCHREEQPC